MYRIKEESDGWNVYRHGWGIGYTFKSYGNALAAATTLNALVEADERGVIAETPFGPARTAAEIAVDHLTGAKPVDWEAASAEEIMEQEG